MQKLGELIAAHPTEARSVLRRVRGLLLSSSWDTRVAAGHAVAAIASQTPRFTPGGWRAQMEMKSEKESTGCLDVVKKGEALDLPNPSSSSPVNT